MNLPVSDLEFLTTRFRDFYKKNPVSDPPDISFREFGAGEFGKKISARHLSFGNFGEFNSFLVNQVPFFVSYSPAYYRFPGNRPMSEKGWLHSDIVYEFDSDDLRTPCQSSHDSWTCKSCNKTGSGSVEACDSCGSQSISVSQWVCEKCLEAVKKKVLRLVESLQSDFGFSEGFSFNFSGSKGFHIHLRSKAVQSLSPKARIELLDYLTGTNLDLQSIGFVEQSNSIRGPPFSQSHGWGNKILSKVNELLEQNDASLLSLAGGNASKASVSKVLSDRDHAWDSISKGVFPGGFSKSALFWKNVLEFAVDELRLPVDRQTSLDKYKIIRVPQTLHGSTGLLAKKLSFNSFSSFDALGECVVFSDQPVKVFVESAPRFSLRAESFGPFDRTETELPEFAAVFLLCRSAAKLEQKN